MCKVNILELEIRDVKLISKVFLEKVNIDCIAQGLQTQCIHYSICNQKLLRFQQQ